MLFTIITIIFLPLSFMSSVFGMNASDFQTNSGGDSLTLRKMFIFLFPISLLIILISVSLAFSTWIRSGLYALSTIVWAALFEYTLMRRLWLWGIHKCGLKIREGREDGFYSKGAEIKRWIYDRREREDMRKEWAAAKERLGREKRGNGDNEIGKSEKIRKKSRWRGRGQKRDIDGRGFGSSQSSNVEGETIYNKV